MALGLAVLPILLVLRVSITTAKFEFVKNREIYYM